MKVFRYSLFYRADRIFCGLQLYLVYFIFSSRLRFRRRMSFFIFIESISSPKGRFWRLKREIKLVDPYRDRSKQSL